MMTPHPPLTFCPNGSAAHKAPSIRTPEAGSLPSFEEVGGVTRAYNRVSMEYCKFEFNAPTHFLTGHPAINCYICGFRGFDLEAS